MKPVLIITVLLSFCLLGRGQLILNAGEQYTYKFNSLPVTGFSFFGPPPRGHPAL